MLRLETIDPLADRRWQHLVEHGDGGIFHHADWIALLRRQYRYPVHARCVSDGGELVAGLPFALVDSRLTGRRLVALPFSDVCEPVVRAGEDESVLLPLLDDLRRSHPRDGMDIEIRARLPSLGRDGERYLRHAVPLAGGVAEAQRRLSKMTARGVARARRDGVEVLIRTDERALRDFYRLHLLTRRRQGMPTQPKRFIQRFADLFERSLGFVMLARIHEETIAAGVFLRFKGVLTYKYGASAHAQLRHRPNHAIFMQAIQWSCEHGIHTLDLGRCDLDNEGLSNFKRGWGAVERPLVYTLLSQRAARPGTPGARRVLAAAISRTPAIAGRLVGAALYRHFG